MTFEELYATYAERVLALVWLLGVAERDRADVAQEVWIVVLRRLASYDPTRAPVLAWLGGITRKSVSDWRRKTQRRPEFFARGQVAEQELPDLRTPETASVQQQLSHALRGFLFQAIANQERREAFVLHVYFGQTVAEVAKTMDVSVVTVETRLKMARHDLERARAAMSDEDRDKLRAVVASFATVDDLVEAMRPTVSDEELAAQWDRLLERIEREGLDPRGKAGQSTPPAAPLGSPPRFAFTGAQLAAGVVGVFLAGAAAGAGGLFAWVSRDVAQVRSAAVMDAIPGPAPVSPEERSREPEPIVTALPIAPRATDPGAVADSAALLRRARDEIGRSPGHALALVNEHARRFPRTNAAEREAIAIRALLQQGERGAARERAARLVKLQPSARAEMEAAFGPSFL